MLRKSTAILSLAFAMAAASLLSVSQQKHVSSKKTFSSADGDFQFQYPSWFVDCAHATGEDASSCVSYMPICSGTRTSEGAQPVCVAYPRSKVGEGTNFGGAAFVVDKFRDAHDESTCTNVEEDAAGPKSHQTINGVDFAVGELDGAAGGHALGGSVYRTFRNQTCYELDINVAAVDPGIYDAEGRPKRFDVTPIYRALEQVLASFKFLK